jgi:hypothetical protein
LIAAAPIRVRFSTCAGRVKLAVPRTVSVPWPGASTTRSPAVVDDEGVVSGPAGHAVGARPAVETVVAVVPEELVVALLAEKPVVAPAAAETVGADPAVEGV